MIRDKFETSRQRAPVPGFDRSRRSIVFWGVIVFALIGVPLLYQSGLRVPGLLPEGMQIDNINMLGRYVAFAILAVALDLVWGYSGVLCLCQSLFFALGGYAMGMYLAMHGPLDQGNIPRCLYVVSSAVSGFKLPWFWAPFESMTFGVVAGLFLPGLLAAIVGYFGFASRVRGVYFAILTQALTLAVWNVFCLNNMLLCGTNGLTNFVTIAGWPLSDPHVKLGLYIATVLLFVLVYLLCGRLVCSRFGRVLIAIRDNESRLRFSGYRPHAFKVFVFTLSAMVAGLAGMIYTPQAGIMTPEYMNAAWSMSVVIWVAVGGRGTLVGAAIGALLVNLMYNFLTTRCPDFWPFVQGALFIGSPLMYAKGMLNARGLLFLIALLAVPPVWMSQPGPEHQIDLLVVTYWAYWILWAACFVLVVWLVWNPNRFKRQFGSIWNKLARRRSVPNTDGEVASCLQVLTALGHSVDSGVEPPTEANGRAKTDDMQRRLSRVSLLRRDETAQLTDSDLLKVDDVQVLFDGFKALDISSFRLGFYELRVIIGPNGAGKTTLCDVISGKTRATKGRVQFAGHEVTNMKDTEIARLGVGRKFQTPTVFDSLTVYQNMELALPGRQGLFGNLVGRTTREEHERILAILRRVRLVEKVDTEVRNLSHGQRQWLEISMLILAGPMLLLVDEPAAGLTDDETVLTAELLLELQDEHSIIVIEHDMDFVRLLSSDVTVLNEGKVMAHGTMDEVQTNPEVIEAYLGR